MIDLRPIKEKAAKLDAPLKTIILSAPDTMTYDEFIAKAQEWLKLLSISEDGDRP
jgi:hypothetical protein